MEVEEEKFARRLEDLLPLLEREINPDNYEDVSHHTGRSRSAIEGGEFRINDQFVTFQIEEEQEEKGADRLLFSYLTLLTKLSKHCGFLELSKPGDTLQNIWGKERTRVTSPLLTNAFCTCSLKHGLILGHIEAHLRYPHCWVWLTASQLFGQLFAAHRAEQLVSVWRGEGDVSSELAATDFITCNLDKKVEPRCLFLFFSCSRLHFCILYFK